MSNELKTVTEEEAAEMLGIRLAELKRLRRDVLLEDEGFVVEGRAIRVTSAGIKKISLAMTQAGRNEAPVVDVPEIAARRVLIVDAVCQNPRILLCHIAADEKKERVRCRVREAKNFTRGMELPGCRMVQETLYAYEGRLPRIRGRWL